MTVSIVIILFIVYLLSAVHKINSIQQKLKIFRNLDDNRAWLRINMKRHPLNNVKVPNRNTPSGKVPTGDTDVPFFVLGGDKGSKIGLCSS